MPAVLRVVCFAVLCALAHAVLGCAAGPPPKDPGAIAATGTLATPLLLAGGERTVYARIRVETKALADRPPGPVNVALCIDTSGSMVGAAIRRAREAAIGMIRALEDGDRLAVVVFNTQTEVVLPSTELDDEVRAEVIEKVGALEAMGTTDLAGGLDAALAEVQRNREPDGVNRVVLVGDGIPNDATTIESTARSAGELGIAITTLGLGLDYDEVLMGKIAELSGGRFRFVESADKVAAFFDEELHRIHTVYARGMTVRLTAGPGVRLDAVVGAPSPPSNGTAYVPLGDIARGDVRDIIVRMAVTPRKADVPVELLDARITFDDGVENAGTFERRVYFGAFSSADEIEVSRRRNAEVELSAALAEAGATTLAALELAKQQHFVRAREMLQKGAEAARTQAQATPSTELEKHAQSMLAVAADMPETDPVVVPVTPTGDAETAIDFDDDAPNGPAKTAPAPSPLSPPAQLRLKQTHDEAYQSSH
jgi:Ca-activated chloride channel family protein